MTRYFIEDFVYSGDIESRPITEKEAKETIEQYKST